MLHVFRGIFVLLCALLGWWAVSSEIYAGAWWQGILVGAGIGFCTVILELAFARRFASVISVLMFGILVGFVVAHFLIAAVDMIPGLSAVLGPNLMDSRSLTYRNFGITFVCCFLSVLAILHTKDDFKFVIPFVELKREGKFGRPLIVDTSVIIDGRIADIVETRVVDTPLIVPRFVLNELQGIADSADRLKRNRGRRGLDLLNRMRQSRAVDVRVQDVALEHVETVDAKLIRVAKMLDGRLVTNDFNLNKVAQVQGVEVININDLAAALRPVLLQGERLRIRIVRTGESAGQGVGYLEDGTMVVAEECAGRIGQEADLVVTNVLQTSAGRLIFARPGVAGEESATRA